MKIETEPASIMLRIFKKLGDGQSPLKEDWVR